MFFDRNFGNLFEVGDYIKYRNIRGVVIECLYPKYIKNTPDVGYYKILTDNGGEFIDYHYVFKLDIESIREIKLKQLGI